jgi:hypothetical protein
MPVYQIVPSFAFPILLLFEVTLGEKNHQNRLYQNLTQQQSWTKIGVHFFADDRQQLKKLSNPKVNFSFLRKYPSNYYF